MAANFCILKCYCLFFTHSEYFYGRDLSVASVPSGGKVLGFIHAARSQVFSGHSVSSSVSSSLTGCCYSRSYSTLPRELVHSGSPSSLSELLGTRSKSLPSVTRKATCVYIATSAGCSAHHSFMWGCELGRNTLRGASEGFIQLFLPSVQAQLVGDLGQSFSTICRIISKEVGVSVFVLGVFPR